MLGRFVFWHWHYKIVKCQSKAKRYAEFMIRSSPFATIQAFEILKVIPPGNATIAQQAES